MCVPMWSPVTTMQLAVRDVTPYLAAPMFCANSCHVSYIAMEGRTTRGNATMSLCTRMLRSTSLRAISVSPLNVGRDVTALLGGGDTAVDIERLPGDEVRRGRHEEQHRADDVAGFGDAAQRDPGDQVAIEVGVLEPARDLRRSRERRCQRVDI